MSHLLTSEWPFQKDLTVDVTDSVVCESGGLPCSGCCSPEKSLCPSLSLWDLAFVSLILYYTQHKVSGLVLPTKLQKLDLISLLAVL